MKLFNFSEIKTGLGMVIISVSMTSFISVHSVLTSMRLKKDLSEGNQTKWHLEKGYIQFLMSLKLKHANQKPNHQHFLPVLTSMRLKPAGHRLIIRLSTDVTGDGHEFNFNEIKKGPFRVPPGYDFKGI